MIRRTARLRWAVAAVVLLSAGAVLAGTGVWTWPGSVVRRLAASPARHESPAASPRRRGGDVARLELEPGSSASPSTAVEPPPVPPASPSTAVEPPPAPAASPSTAVEPPPVPRPAALPSVHATITSPSHDPRPSAAPRQPAAMPRDTQLAEETQTLGRALARLRQARDPAGALAELDRYAARFPSGILGREALAARVDALLMEGRAPDAQAILSRLTLGSNERDRELRLIRAELATGTGCAAALDDYQAVWDAHPDGTWGERALWGQAVCHARLGDEPSARADLTRYLAHFPGGPHAAEARARLR
jgi:hypothetical protein